MSGSDGLKVVIKGSSVGLLKSLVCKASRRKYLLYKRMSKCKFSLYLKKAGLASQNIVHFKT